MYSGQQGLYATGKRFGLGDWSAQQWAQFFQGVEPQASQLIATVTGGTVAAVPSTVVSTPLGQVPTWLIPAGLIAALAFVASRPRRNPPRRHHARRRRRR
jgi:hypothetical protein